MALVFVFVFLFLLLCTHVYCTLADHLSEPLAGSEGLNPSSLDRSFFGRKSAVTTAGIAALFTLAIIIVFKPNKQGDSTERSDHFSLEFLHRFSFDEILLATENFNRASIIGHGRFGAVYGGLIDKGTHTIAIKRLPFVLWDEVKALSKLRHNNLVSLIGYCSESRDMILVYEFMPLGTLAHHLNITTSLSWELCLRICNGVARGLDYLHTHGVTHGRLNTSNILLDENYKPKISHFGLTKPEEQSQRLDIHSFGIVVLEVLCGKTKANSSEQENQAELINWARSLIGNGLVDQIVDPRLNGQISPECLRKFVAISEKCLHDDPKKQPTMTQLVVWLELLLDDHVSGTRMVQDRESQQNIYEASTTAAMPNILEAEQNQKMRENSSGSSSMRRASRGTTDDELPRNLNKESMHQCFSMSEFAAATQNFSINNFLYNGAFSIYRGAHLSTSKESSSYIIYRGVNLPNDSSKLEHISRLSHPNLASILSYSCSDHETVVGYKIEGARLLLHQLSHYNMSWLERLNICIGVAHALRYIHSVRIIHGGISPTTILLDNSPSPKLVTFGSVLTQMSIVDALTSTHLPRDIDRYAKPTEKTDVYLFGLLLLVVFCGNETDYSNGYPFRLPVEVYEAIKKRTLYQITDLSLAKVGEKSLNEFLEVAFHCFSKEQVDRPSMDAVLEGLIKHYLGICLADNVQDWCVCNCVECLFFSTHSESRVFSSCPYDAWKIGNAFDCGVWYHLCNASVLNHAVAHCYANVFSSVD